MTAMGILNQSSAVGLSVFQLADVFGLRVRSAPVLVKLEVALVLPANL